MLTVIITQNEYFYLKWILWQIARIPGLQFQVFKIVIQIAECNGLHKGSELWNFIIWLFRTLVRKTMIKSYTNLVLWKKILIIVLPLYINPLIKVMLNMKFFDRTLSTSYHCWWLFFLWEISYTEVDLKFHHLRKEKDRKRDIKFK